MHRLVAYAAIAVVSLGLVPTVSWAQARGPGMTPRQGPPAAIVRPPHRPPGSIGGVHPRPPGALSGVWCCAGPAYEPPPPPMIVPSPPPVYVIVPSPPALVYVPTPRPEPTPEITLPSGRWARHGNGVDYPYVWVWEGPAPSR